MDASRVKVDTTPGLMFKMAINVLEGAGFNFMYKEGVVD
jgi:hypothetical protein